MLQRDDNSQPSHGSPQALRDDSIPPDSGPALAIHRHRVGIHLGLITIDSNRTLQGSRRGNRSSHSGALQTGQTTLEETGRDLRELAIFLKDDVALLEDSQSLLTFKRFVRRYFNDFHPGKAGFVFDMYQEHHLRPSNHVLGLEVALQVSNGIGDCRGTTETSSQGLLGALANAMELEAYRRTHRSLWHKRFGSTNSFHPHVVLPPLPGSMLVACNRVDRLTLLRKGVGVEALNVEDWLMHLYKVLGEDEQAAEMKRRCALDGGTGYPAYAEIFHHTTAQFDQTHSAMTDNLNEVQETGPSHPPISAQDAVIGEVDEAMARLRIRPRKVLAPLGHLRIEKARIKPLEDKATKAGGQADVQPAILVPAQSQESLGSKETEYIAVKKLRFDTDTDDDKVIAPFAHEVNLLNDLSHPNVVKLVGFVEDAQQGIAWMVFFWEKNGNLREFVRSANWELPERLSLIGDVARGLSYLHGRTPPICHGDLKSLNILVNSKNRAIVTDFGSARRMDSAAAKPVRNADAAAVETFQDRRPTTAPTLESLKAELAASGDFITMTGPAWTIRWAAPELLEGDLPGLASDIWALGWICWEAITGNFPFDEENDVAIVLRITEGDLPAVGDDAQLKQVKVLCSLMGRCWSLNANDRPTAMRCQQEISFMHQVVPSSSKLSRSATTRSSGLLRALGLIQQQNGMMSEAEKHFQESFAVANSVGDKEGKARALDALGDVYYLQSEYSKAEGWYIQARDTYSQTGGQLGFANSVLGLGGVYRMRSEHSKAEESYIQARDTYSQIGDHLGFANSVKGLGHVYNMRSEYSKAEESYIQARDTYSQIGDHLGFAGSVLGLGDLYRMRSENSKAEESFIQARDTYSQIGDQLGFANSVKGLGHVYNMRSEYSKAEESYIQARDTYSQIGSQLGFAYSVEGLGDVYRMRSEYSKAEESYIQARDTYSQFRDQRGFANSVQSLGQAYSASGQYDKAEKSYLEAEVVYRRIGDMASLANNLWYLGWLRRDQAQYGEAKRLVSEASTLYGNLGLKSMVARCHKFLDKVQQRMAA